MTSEIAPKIQAENAPDIGPGLKYWFARQISREKEIGPSAKVVGVALLEFVNSGTGKAWPSLETIAGETGISLRTVKTAVAQLVECGWFAQAKGRTAAKDQDRTERASHTYTPVWEKAGSPPWVKGANFSNEGANSARSQGANSAPDTSDLSLTSGKILSFPPSPQKPSPAEPPKPTAETHVVIGRIRIPADILASWEASYAGTSIKVRPFIEGKSSYLREKHPHTQPNYESELVRHLGNMLASKLEKDHAEALRIQNERIGDARAKAAAPPPPPSKRIGARI